MSEKAEDMGGRHCSVSVEEMKQVSRSERELVFELVPLFCGDMISEVRMSDTNDRLFPLFRLLHFVRSFVEKRLDCFSVPDSVHE